MILEKLRERKRFTNSEKLIAEYVLKHPEQLYQLSVEELGKETYTSKATVIRLCKKLEVTIAVIAGSSILPMLGVILAMIGKRLPLRVARV